MQAFRGALVHFLDDPGDAESTTPAVQAFEDALLVVDAGRVVATGDYATLAPTLAPSTAVVDYRPGIMLPGFVDTHVHSVQTDVIASYGRDLLDWLNRATFPAEARFADHAHAEEVAAFFLDQLLANGTTTASVFSSVHADATDALFTAAATRSLRLIAGKSMMDRNSPADLQHTADASYADSAALIRKWHGHDRLGYAVTPRFAPASTDDQLRRAAQLLDEHPGVWLQSHVAENHDEIAWAAQLFPGRRSYLDVYDHFGLVRPRSIYAHCIHLDDTDRARMATAGAAMSFCPTSNLFLGSGLFDWKRASEIGLRIGLATDVGGGTSYSMLATAAEAYKALQLRGQQLSPLQIFHAMTRGNAVALGLQDKIGSFAIGAECDAVVLDARATSAMARRMETVSSLEEELFLLAMLGDDRAIVETYVMGKGMKSAARAGV